MNPVLSKAIEHFKDRVGDKMLSIEVPEWGTTIYYKAVSSFKEQSAILQLHNQGKVVEALVETIVTKARKEDGTKMFAPADRTVLLNQADPDVILRIATVLNNGEGESFDVEATAKN
jgi:hypothetical protein